MTSLNPLPLILEEAISQAVRLRAAREGVSEGEVIRAILLKSLAPEIDELAGSLPLSVVIQNVMNNGPSKPGE